MAKINWTPEEGSASKMMPGRYLAEVGTKAEVRMSKKTEHPYFNVPFLAVDFGNAFLCYDVIMLDGKGRGMGQKKLEALGFDKGVPSIESSDLIGRRVYVEVTEDEWNGKIRLQVDAGSSPYCGYWPESENPGEVREPSDSAAINMGLDIDTNPDDDTPF